MVARRSGRRGPVLCVWDYVRRISNWDCVHRTSSVVVILGTVALVILGILALVWAQRTFSQMELDFRFTSPAENQVVRGSVLVDGIFSGRGSEHIVTLDGQLIAEQLPYVLDTRTLRDGAHVLSLEIKRAGGGVTKVAGCAFRVDNQPPAILIMTPYDGEIVAGLLTLTYEVRGARPDIPPLFQIDGETREPLSKLETRALADGLHTLTIGAQDDVGNARQVSVTFIVDNTSPQVTWAEPNLDRPMRGNMHLEPDIVEENLSRVLWRLDGDAVGSSPALDLNTSQLHDGNYSLQVSVWDLSGHLTTIDRTVLVDNTPPPLFWSLSGTETVDVYRDQPLPLSLRSEPSANVSVSYAGTPLRSRVLDFSDVSVGRVLEVQAVAMDTAGNCSEVKRSLVVAQSLQSRLNTLILFSQWLLFKLGEPIELLSSLAAAGRYAFSFELCPLYPSPYLAGGRIELDLPSVEIYYQYAIFPGIGFVIPLAGVDSLDDPRRVVMRPKIGFGMLARTVPAAESDEPEGTETSNTLGMSDHPRSLSIVFTELDFSWDFSPWMAHDPIEVTLGFRFGLSRVAVLDDSRIANTYAPEATLVISMKSFFR